jgi:hypothetical protein
MTEPTLHDTLARIAAGSEDEELLFGISHSIDLRADGTCTLQVCHHASRIETVGEFPSVAAALEALPPKDRLISVSG